jgi:2-octaprenyl-6-methoxyphenol hydroxylase
MKNQSYEIAVVGGGPAGLIAAIALAGAGIETALVIGPRRESDYRTTALLMGSVNALEVLGVWTACREHAAPLCVMRIVDDTARLLRAPEVRFDASEIGLEAFGFNIENRHLVPALHARAQALANLTLINEAADDILVEEAIVSIKTHSGATLSARLVVGADGRRSLCRLAAGITTNTRHYRQTALTFNLQHSRPHHNISTEFHTETGPFTLVPLRGNRSSLVCVVDPNEAPHLSALCDADMAAEIERRSHSILGRFNIETGRGSFPLVAETAQSLAGPRIVLIGEAAHVLPPIGAQGLNLGMRDAATISELVADARRAGMDVGTPHVTGRYEHLRRADVTSRAVAVDLFNRSLLSEFLPVQGIRGLGLFLLDQIGPLRRAAMREGVTPMTSQPRLMRGEAL